MNVLTMQDVRKSFGSLEVLKGISLTVGEGEAVSVMIVLEDGQIAFGDCAAVCPYEAIFLCDGVARINPDKCRECGMCAQACPYGAPQLDEKARKMMKCDGCLDRLEKGGAPICVEACPQRAISFGEISELRRTFGTLAVTPPLPDPAQTRPALVIVPSPKAK